MYPAHMIVENYLYSKWPKTKKRQWTKNFTRTLLVVISIIFTLALKNKIGNFLSVLGAVACTPIAFTLPAAFHLKASADTFKQKCIDTSILVGSIVIGVYCTVNAFLDWNKS